MKCIYLRSQSSLAKVYRNEKDKWIHISIQRRVGNFVKRVPIEFSVFVRQTNQLQTSHRPEKKSNFTLPLDTILNTFDLPSHFSLDMTKLNLEVQHNVCLGNRINYKEDHTICKKIIDKSNMSTGVKKRGVLKEDISSKKIISLCSKRELGSERKRKKI